MAVKRAVPCFLSNAAALVAMEPNVWFRIVWEGSLAICRLRGQTMSEYSIYTITHDERSFSDSCAIVHCADDEEAIHAAEQWVDLHDVELWESNRIITRFSPTNLHMSS
jgi:hypothetical protein